MSNAGGVARWEGMGVLLCWRAAVSNAGGVVIWEGMGMSDLVLMGSSVQA